MESKFLPLSESNDRFLVHHRKSSCLFTIFYCFDQEVKEPVILKKFHKKFYDALPIEYLKNSFSLIGKLDWHPNIVNYQSPIIVDDDLYLRQEYISNLEQGTKFTKIISGNLLSTSAILTFLRDICNGMDYFLKNTDLKFHGDLPNNLFLNSSSIIQINNFGLHNLFYSIEKPKDSLFGKSISSFTYSQECAGTPRYMAPEQWKGEIPSVQTDIYSIGCLVYELFSQKPIYESAESISALREHHLNFPVPEVEDEVLNNILQKCLAKDSKKRYSNFSEFLENIPGVENDDHSLEEDETITPRTLISIGNYKALKLLHRGNAFLEIGQPDSALHEYFELIKICPNLAEVHNKMGIAYDKMGISQKSLDSWIRFAELSPRDPEAYYLLGISYSKIGLFEKSIENYEKALKIYPNYVPALINRGNVYYRLNEYDKALNDYNNAIASSSSSIIPYFNRGNIHYDLGNYQEAIEDFTKCIELDPGFTDAYNGRVKVNLKLNHFDNVLQDISILNSLSSVYKSKNSPRKFEDFFIQGLINHEKREYLNALQEFTKAIELNPGFSQAYMRRGLSNLELERYKDALADFNRAIELDKGNAQALCNKGIVLAKTHLYEDALLCFNEAISINPSDYLNWFSRGLTYANLKQYDKAINDFEESIKLNPKYPAAYYNIGVSMGILGKELEPLYYFDRASELGDTKSAQMAKKVRETLTYVKLNTASSKETLNLLVDQYPFMISKEILLKFEIMAIRQVDQATTKGFKERLVWLEEIEKERSQKIDTKNYQEIDILLIISELLNSKSWLDQKNLIKKYGTEFLGSEDFKKTLDLQISKDKSKLNIERLLFLRNLINSCFAKGIDQVFTQIFKTAELVDSYLKAPNFSTRVTFLSENRETLLSKNIDEFFYKLFEQYKNDIKQTQILQGCFELIERAREDGIDEIINNPKESITNQAINLTYAYLEASTWEQKRDLLISNRVLALSEELDHILFVMKGSNNNDGYKKYIQQHRDVLKECRKNGIEETFLAVLKNRDENKILDIVTSFLDTKKWSEKKKIVENHSEELSSPFANTYFEYLLGEFKDNPIRIEDIKRHQKIIKDCIESGVEIAFAPFMILENASELLLRARISNKNQKFEDGIGFCQEILKVIRPEQDKELWGTANLEAARAYLELKDQNNDENLHLAIKHYDYALEVFTYEISPQYWATARANQGSAFFALGWNGTFEFIKPGLIAYIEACKVFSQLDFPENWMQIQRKMTDELTENTLRALNQEGLKEYWVDVISSLTTKAEEIKYKSLLIFLIIIKNFLQKGTIENETEQLELEPLHRTALQKILSGRKTEGQINIVLSKIHSLAKRIIETPVNELDKVNTLVGDLESLASHPLLQSFLQEKFSAEIQLAICYCSLYGKTGIRYWGNKAENLLNKIIFAISVNEYPSVWCFAQQILANYYQDLFEREGNEDYLYKGEQSLKATLQIWSIDNNPEKYASVLKNIGDLYSLSYERSRNEDLFIEALDNYFDAQKGLNRSSMPSAWANVLGGIGLLHARRYHNTWDQLEYNDAEKTLKEALSIFEDTGDQEGISSTYNHLGFLYKTIYERSWKEDYFIKAKESYIKASELINRSLNPVFWALIKYNLGVIYFEKYRISGEDLFAHLCEETHLETLEIRQRSTLPHHWASTQMNLGMLYSARYQFNDSVEFASLAEYHFRAALDVWQKNSFPVNWAMLSGNLANVLLISYKRNHQLENASLIEKILSETISFWKTGKNYHDLALSLNTKGDYYRERYEDTKEQRFFTYSEESYEEAIKIWSTHISNHWLAVVYLKLGELNREYYKQSKEEIYTLRAIACYKNTLKKIDPISSPLTLIMIHYFLGEIYNDFYDAKQDQDVLNKSIWHFQKVVRIGEQLDSGRKYRLDAGCQLIRYYFSKDNWKAVLKFYRAINHIFQSMYNIQILKISKERVLSRYQDIPSKVAYAMAKMGDYRNAARVLELGKARILSESLQLTNLELNELKALSPNLASKLEDVITTINYLSSEEIYGLNEEIIEKQREVNKLLEEIKFEIRKIPGYENFFSIPLMREIQKCLRQEEAIVYITTTEKGSLAIIFTPNEYIGVFANLDSFMLRNLLIEEDQEEIIGGFLPGQKNREWLKTSLEKLSPTIGHELISAIVGQLHVTNASTLYLIPDGLLCLLPLHAASWQKENLHIHFIDEYTISYAPSGQIILGMKKKTNDLQRHPIRFLGMANPLPNSKPLFYAKAEIEGAINFLQKEVITTFYDELATKSALLANITDSTHVHLACHGIYDVMNPMESGLILENEKKVTLRELNYIHGKSQIHLIILSACQTSLTEFRVLPNEAIGLPSAFIQLGASSVVGSMWPVDDKSTALLMKKFYYYHLQEKMPVSRSLCLAQLWLRDLTRKELAALYKEDALKGNTDAATSYMSVMLGGDLEDQPYSSPYFWSAFLTSGVNQR